MMPGMTAATPNAASAPPPVMTEAEQAFLRLLSNSGPSVPQIDAVEAAMRAEGSNVTFESAHDQHHKYARYLESREAVTQLRAEAAELNERKAALEAEMADNDGRYMWISQRVKQLEAGQHAGPLRWLPTSLEKQATDAQKKWIAASAAVDVADGVLASWRARKDDMRADVQSGRVKKSRSLVAQLSGIESEIEDAAAEHRQAKEKLAALPTAMDVRARLVNEFYDTSEETE